MRPRLANVPMGAGSMRNWFAYRPCCYPFTIALIVAIVFCCYILWPIGQTDRLPAQREGLHGNGDFHMESLDVNSKRILETGDLFVVLSLNPGEPLPKATGEKTRTAVPEKFHGYQVLGQIEVRDATTRAELVAALERGILEADGLRGCFEPRHGIRAADGGETVDLVICFECVHMYVYRGQDASNPNVVSISQSPLPVFRSVLDRAGIPTAPSMFQ